MRFLYLLIISIVFSSCTEDIFVASEPQMIVEGWIDADGFPVVILTEAIVVDNTYRDYSDINNHMIKWAKVTVSDGDNDVVLTGKATDDYFPPYIYTTAKMRGKAGKKYKLTVEYKNYYAEAETVIPDKLLLDSIVVKHINDNDSLCYLNAYFLDSPFDKNYYKFFTKVDGRDSFYLSSNLAVYDDAQFENDSIGVTIYSGNSIHDEIERSYFNVGDRVFVKFAHIDCMAFAFWEMYRDVVAFSRNFIMPYSRNLPSNIVGAHGYWFGYGAAEYMVDVK
jgi:hypothetical protein